MINTIISIFKEPSWTRFFAIAFLVDWLIGIVFVQFFYFHTRKLRNLDPQFKEKLKPFVNEPEKWNWLIHTIFSIFMVPRMLINIFCMSTLPIIVRILLIGTNPAHASQFRKKLIRLAGQIYARLTLFGESIIWINYVEDNIDYTKWLGRNYKVNISMGRPPIVISNHRAPLVFLFILLIQRMYTY